MSRTWRTADPWVRQTGASVEQNSKLSWHGATGVVGRGAVVVVGGSVVVGITVVVVVVGSGVVDVVDIRIVLVVVGDWVVVVVVLGGVAVEALVVVVEGI